MRGISSIEGKVRHLPVTHAALQIIFLFPADYPTIRTRRGNDEIVYPEWSDCIR